jgi:translation elongation factor EF-1alpha
MLFLSGMLVSSQHLHKVTVRKMKIFFFLLILLDAGKSTIGGQIMSLTGMVDKRTLEKYEREAREKSRESWYLSWALDTNQEGKKHYHLMI